MRQTALAALATVVLSAGCGGGSGDTSDDPEAAVGEADARLDAAPESAVRGDNPDSPREIIRECGSTSDGKKDLRLCLFANGSKDARLIPPPDLLLPEEVPERLDDCINVEAPFRCARIQVDFPSGSKGCNPADQTEQKCGLTGLDAVRECRDRIKDDGRCQLYGAAVRVIGGEL